MEWIVTLLALVIYFAMIIFVIIDASENSKNPMLFWVIAVILFAIFGLLAYLLVGREWPENAPPRNHKGRNRRPWEE